MGLRAWNVGLLAAIGALWLASGTQREKPVIEDARATAIRSLRSLEAQVSASPGDVAHRQELAQAYLDARLPGLAVAVVEAAPPAVRSEPRLDHVYARALIEQGRSAAALAAEESVLASCAPGDDGVSRCDTWLLASATRRAEILHHLVELGVEDAPAHPEASAIAYHNATREAKLAVQ